MPLHRLQLPQRFLQCVSPVEDSRFHPALPASSIKRLPSFPKKTFDATAPFHQRQRERAVQLREETDSHLRLRRIFYVHIALYFNN